MVDGDRICILHRYPSTAILAITFLPQVAETNTPQPQDVAGEYFLYDWYVTHVYVANFNSEEDTDLKWKLAFLSTITEQGNFIDRSEPKGDFRNGNFPFKAG